MKINEKVKENIKNTLLWVFSYSNMTKNEFFGKSKLCQFSDIKVVNKKKKIESKSNKTNQLLPETFLN